MNQEAKLRCMEQGSPLRIVEGRSFMGDTALCVHVAEVRIPWESEPPGQSQRFSILTWTHPHPMVMSHSQSLLVLYTLALIPPLLVLRFAGGFWILTDPCGRVSVSALSRGIVSFCVCGWIWARSPSKGQTDLVRYGGHQPQTPHDTSRNWAPPLLPPPFCWRHCCRNVSCFWSPLRDAWSSSGISGYFFPRSMETVPFGSFLVLPLLWGVPDSWRFSLRNDLC